MDEKRAAEMHQRHMKLEMDWHAARLAYAPAVAAGVAMFNEGKKQEAQDALRKAHRALKLADRTFHRGLKRMYPRAWPPPKHEKHKTSFKKKPRE